jgi:tagatose-1,6-bisphosphate aldolase non-catalytic subunit AgaZ/GatZ
MRHRNWKRVLGETSLERKCRLLFGFWLTLLISGAFWGVENVSSDLILRNTRTTARDVVDVALMKPRFSSWETRADQKEFADTVLKELSLSDGIRKLFLVSPCLPRTEAGFHQSNIDDIASGGSGVT